MTAGTWRREDGFALLIVLWALALLALLGTAVTAAGRGETQLASNLRDSAAAEAAADAAVYQTIYYLLDTSQNRWAADGIVHQLALPHARAVVTATDQGGKVDLNMSSLPLLQALLRQVGVDNRTAISLAAAIVDWRSPSTKPLPQGAKAPQYRAAGRTLGPPNAPYRDLDEVRLVLGMTPELLARLRPYIALHLEGPPKPAVAPPLVQRALVEAAANGDQQPMVDDEDRPLVVQIVAEALSAGGGRFTRVADVRINLGTSSSAGRLPYEILNWQSQPGAH
jgi:general secretion pathway protein K